MTCRTVKRASSVRNTQRFGGKRTFAIGGGGGGGGGGGNLRQIISRGTRDETC